MIGRIAKFLCRIGVLAHRLAWLSDIHDQAGNFMGLWYCRRCDAVTVRPVGKTPTSGR